MYRIMGPASSIFYLFLLISCQQDLSKDSSPPNIVMIMTDDQGWGDLSMHGNRMIHTPIIDEMAREGVTFDRFYVCPVCSPTRAEILTGRYHVRGGVYDTGEGGERLDLDEVTFAQVFQDAGYKTAAYGKWHNGMQYPYHPNARGFDDYYGFASGHWGNYFSPVLEHNGQLVHGQGFLVDDLTDRAIEFIEENHEDPFLVYLPYNTPHSPMQVPDRWWNKFKDMPLEQGHRYKEQEDVAHTKAAYAMCENIDWNVGRILEKLDTLGLDENTIVLFLSDNGPNGWRWNGDMKGRKGWTDEGGVRSPLIIRWKGTLPAGKTIKQIAGAIDLYPTLADLAGLQYATEKMLDGKSLKALCFDQDIAWEDRLIFSYWNERTSARSQRYRLDHEGQLFDMINDPGQRTDISTTESEIHTELVEAKDRWEKEVLNELKEADPRPFPVGHPDFPYTQLPARDADAHGGIIRSNQWPNCSFYTNWLSVSDSMSWDVEVLEEGDYQAVIYYTCAAENVGCTLELTFLKASILSEVNEAHDPPLRGMENDKVLRVESYVKDFKPHALGVIHLLQGPGKMTLKATQIIGQGAVDFRLMMLERI